MLKMLLSGCNGRMGQTIAALCETRRDMAVVAGLDTDGRKLRDFPVYADPLEFGGYADVVTDFSHPSALPPLLAYCRKRRTPLVVATTGHDDGQLALLREAAGEIPVFMTGNMSLGINLLQDLLARAAAVLGADYDVEIIERHHNKKVDAPSGTAKMLYDTLDSALPYDTEPVYDRHAVRAAREKREIGMHTVRGGGIVGDHTVLFASGGEVIELTHRAISREVFAEGAVRAAIFMATRKKPGLYSMRDLLESIGI